MAPTGTASLKLVCSFLAAIVVASPAVAQSPDANSPRLQKKSPVAPAKPLRSKSDRFKNLDFLFGALKAAPDAESAKAVEARIWAVWTSTPSDTAALLMARAKTAMDQKDMGWLGPRIAAGRHGECRAGLLKGGLD